MFNIYFENSYGTLRLITTTEKEEDIVSIICDEVHKINPEFTIYYIRSWGNYDEDGKTYDVGSHTEFFIVKRIKD